MWVLLPLFGGLWLSLLSSLPSFTSYRSWCSRHQRARRQPHHLRMWSRSSLFSLNRFTFSSTHGPRFDLTRPVIPIHRFSLVFLRVSLSCTHICQCSFLYTHPSCLIGFSVECSMLLYPSSIGLVNLSSYPHLTRHWTVPFEAPRVKGTFWHGWALFFLLTHLYLEVP